MSLKKLLRSSYPLILFVLVFSGVFTFLRLSNIKSSSAVSLDNFNPGNIITDYVMSKYDSMSESEIQAFLDKKGDCRDTRTYLADYYTKVSYHIKDGHFVCLAEETFGKGTDYGEDAPDGDSAAHIIYEAARDYRINPQVLIVLLQKEQGLITDSWPNSIQYRSATGYGCPDTAACSEKYYGFRNQVRNAAAMFRSVLDGGWTNYPVGDNYIQYNPDSSCGGSTVYIENLATSSLYRYTPYQPNASSLAAGYGTGNSCGAYGNRNFYLYFNDWFGNSTDDDNSELRKKIEKTKTELESDSIIVGSPIGKILKINNSENYYAIYSEGVFYLHNDYDAVFIKNNSILNKFREYGRESGRLGYPTSNLKCNLVNGYCYQLFENAVIYLNPKTDIATVVFTGSIRDKYREKGLERGELGYPTSDEGKSDKDGLYQLFEGGVIYYSPKSGTYIVKNGNMRDTYRRKGLERGELGYPTSDEKDEVQEFENGIIYHNNSFSKKIFEAYMNNSEKYGSPVNDSICNLKNNGCYQVFSEGIVYSSSKGVYIVKVGKMLDEFRKHDREKGIGYPISNEENNSQEFENGTIKLK